MSQDANQKQEPYAGYSGYAPQEYYGTQENPYGAGENDVEDAPPYVLPPFGTQGIPGAYSPPPFGYANPFQAPPQPGYGYQPPRSKEPLPLGQAFKALPGQYYRILTKPGSITFAEEMGKASWDIIWVQLIIISVITAVLTLLALLIVAFFISSSSSDSSSLTALPSILIGFSFVIMLLVLILVPVSFFVGTGISYLIAKAFDGKGTFLEQCYTTMLITAPVTFLNVLLRLIPFLGSLAAFALSIYSIILQIYALMAVHRVSGGKAALIYFIPWIALAVIYVVFVSIMIFVLFSALHVH